MALQFPLFETDSLLSFYHNHLVSVTLACSMDISSLYTMSDVRNDFNEGLTVALWYGIFAMNTMLADSEDSSEFAELDHTNEKALDEFQERDVIRLKKVIGSNAELRGRLRGVFEDLIELGFM